MKAVLVISLVTSVVTYDVYVHGDPVEDFQKIHHFYAAAWWTLMIPILFILRFGLNKDMVEGQVFKVLDNLLDSYVAELMKSMRFFQTKYLNAKIGGIILAGFGGMIPLFPEYIEAKTGVATISGDPWQLTRITPEQRQILAGVTNEFAVAVGLAERSND